MKVPTLSQRNYSQLAIIDVQERLAAVMAADQLQKLVKNCGILLQAAAMLEIPAIYTEQYPKGLGNTVPELLPWLKPEQRVEKTAFSCSDEPGFCRKLTGDRPQIILAGMEAHICILQTALHLQEMGHQVFVVEDAVLARDPINKANALERLRQAGVILSNTESILFEWLGAAEGEAFKQISRLVR
ncbi:MAG TPA: isochorismatase family protein [Methylophilaceae bacterium]|nr:isochorismatase family protein [Methylophilaceae bacterium]